jgi:hypothetical protein
MGARKSQVHRLANNGDAAGGQLPVFQGTSEGPIPDSYGSSEQRGKTADWPRPGGLHRKWAGVRVIRRLRIDSDMHPLTASPARTALPAAHFERNDVIIIPETAH